MLTYINFSFDFLGLHNVYFKYTTPPIYSSDGSLFKPFKLKPSLSVFYQIQNTRAALSCFISDKAPLLVFSIVHRTIGEDFFPKQLLCSRDVGSG